MPRTKAKKATVKKVVKKLGRKKTVRKEKPVDRTFDDDIQLEFTNCLVCGKPSTIISPAGRLFCCLGCQSIYGD